MHRFPVEGPVAHVYADMLNVSRWTRCLNAPLFYHRTRSEATFWLDNVLCHNADYFLDLLGKIAYLSIQSIRLETIGPRGESIQPAIAKVDT